VSAAYATDMYKVLEEHYTKKGYQCTGERMFSSTFGSAGRTIFDFVAGRVKDLRGSKEIEFIGVEIKSDHDSYNRLWRQLPDYVQLFDRVYLAVSEKEVPKTLPDNVGVLQVLKDDVRELRYSRIEKHVGYISQGEKNALLDAMALKDCKSEFFEAMEMVARIEKKLAYNRFFGNMDWQRGELKTPLTFDADEIRFLMQFGIQFDKSEFRKKINSAKNALESINKTVNAIELAFDSDKPMQTTLGGTAEEKV
jgi:hypothetical protein